MTPARLDECLTALRWSQTGLAGWLHCAPRLVRRWAAGEGRIPEPVASALETLVAVHQAHPPPQGWKTR